MCGAIPPLSITSPWCGAQLKIAQRQLYFTTLHVTHTSRLGEHNVSLYFVKYFTPNISRISKLLVKDSFVLGNYIQILIFLVSFRLIHLVLHSRGRNKR